MKKQLISILVLVTMLFTLLPAQAITVVADNVAATDVPDQEQTKNVNPFTDVQEGSWYYDAVLYAFINGFFNGTAPNTFNPDGTMTRAMFVTVLGRMADVDASAYAGQSNFGDVPADAWYAPYVAWAAKYGITTGVGGDKFDPDGLINREQMAVFLVRYFEAFGVDYETGANVTTVPADLDKVSPWAREMVLKLWRTGLMAGDGVNFDPLANATRAQAATLCMRTDRAVQTWYSEPGVPSDRVSIVPGTGQKPEAQDSSNGDSDSEAGTDNPGNETGAGSNDGTSAGNSGAGTETGGSDDESSTTYYYKVTFVIDSITEEKMYQEGTLLSTLPVPAQPTGKVFLGWYYDAEKNRPVTGDDRLYANKTLYAKFTDAIKLEENGAPNFISALDQTPDFSIQVRKTDGAPVPGTDFKFRNITAPDRTPETAANAEDMANIETVKVECGNGVWIISSAGGGFTPGHTYQIELLNDAVTYDDSASAVADFIAAHGQENLAGVRYFNFSIENTGTMNLKLNSEIIYIPVSELTPADGASLMEYAGLYLASIDDQGNTTYTASNGSGSFTYTGSRRVQAGDTVAVYAGTKPTERLPEKGTVNKTDNGDVSYLKITRVDGSTYYYEAAEAEEVLFKPDVLPVDVDIHDGTTGWQPGGTSVIIDNGMLDFSAAIYESMGLSSETTVDIGDFLAFFTGVFGDPAAQDLAYGEITAITDNGDGTTTITYQEVSLNHVLSAMDLYDETQLSETEIQAAIEENKDEIQRIIEAQLMESDFFDEAGEYLAGLAIQTDEIKEIFGDDLTLSDCIITYADGTPIGAQDLLLMGNIIDNEQDGRKPKVSVTISPRMAHFDQILAGLGFRAEVAVSYKFKIQKKGSNNVVEVELTAFFEQEFTASFKVSGDAVWKWKWIIPYIADYRITGHLDLGTYTGIGITATAKLKEEKEPWGMPWPNSAREAAATKKIFSLSESIRKMMKEAEKIIPEEEATASGDLAEKYARLMEDANEEWVDLITATLMDMRSAVDPLHILAFGLKVDFVVSANLNVAIGMTFQYENFKRHSFTLLVLSKKGESETIDLSTNGYQFDFYVMGTIGIRAGVRVKITAGLFSTKLAAIGIQVEAGAYIRLWGYFYYHLENWRIQGVWQKDSSHSGALLVEVGAYLDVKFIAEALNGKYSYTPSIYTKEWPLWSAGQRENVYDFAYENDPTYAILNVTTYTLPKTVFDMAWMDLKTGEVEEGSKQKIKNYDSSTVHNGDDEAYFAVDLSNPNFTYNPANNQIKVNTASGEVAQSCDMKIIWKGAPLAYSSETLSRTIKLHWSNENNAATIVFESNGGSAVPMLRLLTGTALTGRMPADPTRHGYTFAGWYTDTALNNAFNATVMPAGNTTLYARWTPGNVSYTVEHYQKALDGRYVLVETDSTQTGRTGEMTAAVARSYAGFTAQTVKQQTITADGSTRVVIYYDRNLYDLKFVYGNGSNDITLQVPYGSAIVKPTNPAKAGYTFAGWDMAIPDTMPANALIITALWTAKADTPYMVKHYKQRLDETYELDLTEEKTGTTGRITEAVARNYTGFTAQDFTQKTILPNGSVIVEIYYNRNIHTLTWNVNGGNALTGRYTNGSVKYGTPIDKPETPTRMGFSFAGWYKDAELTKVLEDNATMPDTALTLNAKWIKTDAGYTVKHIRQDLDGSYPSSGSLVETEGKSGIIGQNTDARARSYEGFTAQDFTQKPIAADDSTMVEIRYTRNSYTITFNGNGSDGGSMNDQVILYGESKSLTTNGFTKTGHSFTGWNTKADGSGMGYTDGTLVTNLTGDITLYAQWATQTFTVTFDPNMGSGSTEPPTVIQVVYGGTYHTLPIISRTGYTLNGWFTETNGGTAVKSTDVVVDDHTLYAQWTANTYTVVFDGNGSDGGFMQPQTFTYDMEQDLTANTFTKTGHIFTGWKTAADGSGTGYADRQPVKNLTGEANGTVTLYAQWQADAFTDYDIWVDGIRVTSTNANNVLGDGKVSYHATTNTLTLNGVSLEYGSSDPAGGSSYNTGAIYVEGDLIIELAAGTTNTIINQLSGSFWNCGIYVSGGDLTITGAGTLFVKGGFGYTSHGISIDSGDLYIHNGTITVEGRTAQGVSGIYAFGNITVNGGTLTATAGEAAAGVSRGFESGFGTITVNGGTVEAAGEDIAIDGAFTTAAGLQITASTDINGIMGEYIPANLSNYRRIKVEPQP